MMTSWFIFCVGGVALVLLALMRHGLHKLGDLERENIRLIDDLMYLSARLSALERERVSDDYMRDELPNSAFETVVQLKH